MPTACPEARPKRSQRCSAFPRTRAVHDEVGHSPDQPGLMRRAALAAEVLRGTKPGCGAQRVRGSRAPREWQRRAGPVELRNPKIRQGSYLPSFLEPRKRGEQALSAVIQQAYVCGVSTRRVDQLVESLGLRISRSEVSRVCQGLAERVDAFRTRPLEGRYPYLFLNAKVQKVRAGGRVVGKALVIADGVTSPGGARSSRSMSARPRPRRLDGVPAWPRRARPDRRPARDLRRPQRAA